jgi:hypothetical protein
MGKLRSGCKAGMEVVCVAVWGSRCFSMVPEHLSLASDRPFCIASLFSCQHSRYFGPA